MIQYSTGYWSVKLLFLCEGSVFPRAVVWSLPASLNALLFHYVWFKIWEFPALDKPSAFGAVWSGFAFVLGFLIVFRTQQAYTRYWEGATLVQQARANFFNACSSVVAFCTTSKEMRPQVDEFQHLLVRLMSMLHCVGLQTVVDQADVKFEFFNTNGIDRHALRFLTSKSDKFQRSEIVIQWIQRLVVDASRERIIDVPPPILTRFFQELSQGAVHIINARNMTNIPFPFPYAQLLTMLLVVFWMVSPVFYAMLLEQPLLSPVFSFITTFAFFGTNYIAAELESPFGDDPNDLPLYALQQDMNKSLWVLLDPMTQAVPHFEYDKEIHREYDVIQVHHFPSISDDGYETESRPSTKSKMWMAANVSEKGKKALFDRLPRLNSKVSLPMPERSTRATKKLEVSSGPRLGSRRSVGNSTSQAASSIGTASTGARTPTSIRGEASGQHAHFDDFSSVPRGARSPASTRGEDGRQHRDYVSGQRAHFEDGLNPADQCADAPANLFGAASPAEVSLDIVTDALPMTKLSDVARYVNDYMHQLSEALKNQIQRTIKDLQLLQSSVEWRRPQGVATCENDPDNLRVASEQESAFFGQFQPVPRTQTHQSL